MHILAIETSASACSVALLHRDEIYTLTEIAPMQQARLILPMVEQVLQKAQTTLNQLDAIAFGCGPGSFTGVRIATSVAQGFGFAANIPLIPVSSLAALAQNAYLDLGYSKVIVAVDARIQEIYLGAYEINPDGLMILVGEEQVCHPEAVQYPAGDNWHGIGNGWDVYRDQLNYQPIVINSNCLPDAKGVLQLAKKKFILQTVIKASDARPSYLRNEVAKKSI